VTGDAEKLGKATGADAVHVKATYPALLGVEEAQRLAGQAITDALEALATFGPEADAFRALAHFVIDRDR